MKFVISGREFLSHTSSVSFNPLQGSLSPSLASPLLASSKGFALRSFPMSALSQAKSGSSFIVRLFQAPISLALVVRAICAKFDLNNHYGREFAVQVSGFRLFQSGNELPLNKAHQHAPLALDSRQAARRCGQR